MQQLNKYKIVFCRRRRRRHRRRRRCRFWKNCEKQNKADKHNIQQYIVCYTRIVHNSCILTCTTVVAAAVVAFQFSVFLLAFAFPRRR